MYNKNMLPIRWVNLLFILKLVWIDRHVLRFSGWILTNLYLFGVLRNDMESHLTFNFVYNAQYAFYAFLFHNHYPYLEAYLYTIFALAMFYRSGHHPVFRIYLWYTILRWTWLEILHTHNKYYGHSNWLVL